MSEAIIWILAILNFVGELGVWIGVGRLAWRQLLPSQPQWAVAGGILATVIVVLLWSLFLASKSDYKLSLWPRIAVISVATIVTGYLLYRGQDKVYGLVLMIPLTIAQAVTQYVRDGM